MKFITYIFLISVASLFDFQSNNQTTTTLIQGHTFDEKSGEPLPFVGIKFFINDTLINFSISDFDGKFRIKSDRHLEPIDKLDLQFHYARNYFQEKRVKIDSTTDLKISMLINDSLTLPEIMEWKKSFLHNLPNHKECLVDDIIYDFEIKE